MAIVNKIAPIASATSVDQLAELMDAMELVLSAEEMRRLDDQSSVPKILS